MQPLLSEHWHTVRRLRPRLRGGVQALHRRLRGKPWVLLLDPVTQRYHRIAPRVWHVLELLDGRRTLEEVWNEACARAAREDANGAPISQHELVTLMSQLHANDLLQTDAAPDAAEVEERYRRQRRARLKQSLLNPMSMKLPLLHPDPWFERQSALARAMFSGPVALLWLALVLPATVLSWQHWDTLTTNLSDRVLSASNLALLWLTYPLVKAIHEWAHGMAVKAWGGTVREMGLIFIVLMPVPYVDATSSYGFPSKWSRAAVAAAGIMAELALGAVALYVWLLAEPGLVTAVAFNVVLIAGVSTLLINGNPLLRYDGYYILCDVLELPNLGQRANQYLTYLCDRYLFGARDAQPPQEVAGERRILLPYGLMAPVYRLFITFGLIWFVASEYLFVGTVMALMALWSVLVMPLWKGWKHLREGASLAQRRDSAMRRTALIAVALFAFAGLVPMPFHSLQQGVVWLPDEAIIRAEVAGHVVAAGIAPGQSAAAGQTLLNLENPALVAELGSAAAAVAQTEARLRRAEVDDRARVEPLRTELSARESRLREAERRVDAMQVRAVVQGRWMPAPTTELVGRHARRGEVLGFVVPGPGRLVRAAVTQDDMALIKAGAGEVRLRLANRPERELLGQVQRQVPGGEFELVSQALGTNGGGSIPVDPGSPGGRKSLARVFDLEIAMQEPSPVVVFGDRVHVRFDLGPAPLGWQAFVRLRQLFLARLNV